MTNEECRAFWEKFFASTDLKKQAYTTWKRMLMDNPRIPTPKDLLNDYSAVDTRCPALYNHCKNMRCALDKGHEGYHVVGQRSSTERLAPVISLIKWLD